MNHQGDQFKRKSNRPRLIYNPPMWVKSLGGFYNWILMDALKQCSSEYCGGLNREQLKFKMEQAFASMRNPVSLAADGKSHDSN